MFSPIMAARDVRQQNATHQIYSQVTLVALPTLMLKISSYAKLNHLTVVLSVRQNVLTQGQLGMGMLVLIVQEINLLRRRLSALWNAQSGRLVHILKISRFTPEPDVPITTLMIEAAVDNK
jgi:hypothetical protein